MSRPLGNEASGSSRFDVRVSLEAVLDVLAEPVLVVSRDEHVRFANGAATRRLGAGRDALQRVFLRTLLADESRAEASGWLSRCWNAADASHLDRHRVVVEHASGAREPAELSFGRLPLEGEGEPLALLSFCALTPSVHTATPAARPAFAGSGGEVFAHHPHSIFVLEVTEGGQFVVAAYNPVALGLTGFSLDAILGKPLEEFLPEGVLEPIVENYRRCVTAGRPVEYEETFDFGSGPRVFQTTLVPIRDGNGRIYRLAGFAHDVTARHRAEQTLRENQRMLDTLLSNLPGAVYRCRNDPDWTIEFGSDGFRLLTGYGPADLVGNRNVAYGSLIHPEDQASVWGDVQASLARRQPFELVYRIRPRDGGERWVWERGRGVYTSSGELTAIEGFITDITERRRAEQALAESERALRAILDQSFQFVALLDREGRIVRANQTALDLAAVRASDVQERFFWDSPWWSDASSEEQKARAAVARGTSGQLVRFEAAHRGGDGGQLIVDYSLKPVHDEAGRVTGLILEGRDITELKLAEQALRESEERFFKAFHASPDSITISEFETGRILETNDGFDRCFGWTRAEALGRTTLELDLWVVPEQRRHLYDCILRDGGVRDFAALARRKDGELRHVLISMERSEINRRPCAITVSRDVTDRFRAEQALRESEERFSKAFRSSPYALSISEAEAGRYIDVNGAFEALTGFTREDVIGRTAVELGIWPSAAERAEFLQRLRQTGSVRQLEIVLRTRAGAAIPVRNSSELIEIGGRACIVSTNEDLTHQRAVEQSRTELEAQLRQAQKLEALGTLAGGIAHDFNNILSAVFAYVDLSELDLTRPDELRLHLVEVRRAAERARDLVSQILAFSRRQSPERKATDFAKVLREALKLVRPSLPATVAIVCEVDSACPRVLADPTQLQQVVMNLCTNAAHAMREPGGQLHIELAPAFVDAAMAAQIPGLSPGAYVRLSVTDSGHGMTDATMKRIFEPFFTTKSPGEGTGLGLSVVHGIVRDHEGAITVQSRPGAGTRFTVYLPKHQASSGEVAAVTTETPSSQGEHLLVIDDEQAICRTLQALLQRLGYRVTACSDPVDALARFTADPGAFDLILTDLTMPGMTGIDVAQRALELRPGLPVLLTSGFSATWTPEKVRMLGILDLLDKPLLLPVLAAAIRAALRGEARGRPGT